MEPLESASEKSNTYSEGNSCHGQSICLPSDFGFPGINLLSATATILEGISLPRKQTGSQKSFFFFFFFVCKMAVENMYR